MIQMNQFSSTIMPPDLHYFPLKVFLPRFNFLEIFHQKNEFWIMKVLFHLFATEMKFFKLSVISVFSNYHYSLERKPGNAG